MLATAALVHDIGKIGAPDSILTKHDPSREEQEFMRVRNRAAAALTHL